MASSAIDDELSCAICMEKFKDPRNLTSCGHSFCRRCLEPLVEASTITCPQCRETTQLGCNGVAGLSKNYIAGNVIARYGAMPETAPERASESSVGRRTRAPSDQWEITIEGLPDRSNACPDHGKEVDLYCIPCEQTICSLCLVNGKHKGHNADDLMTKYTSAKDHVASLRSQLLTYSISEKDQAQEIADTIMNIQEAGRVRTAQIQQTFSDLRMLLSEKEAKLLEEVESSIAMHCAEVEEMADVPTITLQTIHQIDNAMTFDPVVFLQNLEELKDRCSEILRSHQVLPADIELPEFNLNVANIIPSIQGLYLLWDTEKAKVISRRKHRGMSKWTLENIFIKKTNKDCGCFFCCHHWEWEVSQEFIADIKCVCKIRDNYDILKYLGNNLGRCPRYVGDFRLNDYKDNLNQAATLLLSLTVDSPEKAQKRLRGD